MAIRHTISVLALAAASVIGASPWERADEPERRGDRATYEKASPAALKLKEPVRVTQYTHQDVPTSIILVLRDAGGVTHRFDWWLDTGDFQNREFGRIDWLRYAGEDALSGDRSRLSPGGPEEVALYGVMLRWAAGKGKEKDITPFDGDAQGCERAPLEARRPTPGRAADPPEVAEIPRRPTERHGRRPAPGRG